MASNAVIECRGEGPIKAVTRLRPLLLSQELSFGSAWLGGISRVGKAGGAWLGGILRVGKVEGAWLGGTRVPGYNPINHPC